MEWYYSNRGQRHGPYSPTEFARLVAAGTVRASTLVWRQGMSEWTTCDEATGFHAAPDRGRTVVAVSGGNPPLAAGADGVASAPFGYGGFWRRVLASFVDQLALGLLVVPLAMALAFALGFTTAANGRTLGDDARLPLQLMAPVLWLVVGLAYQVFFLRMFGATPGKMVLDLKIAAPGRAKLSLVRIVGRYFCHLFGGVVFGLGHFMAGWDPEKRALHDRVCGTRVVKTRP